MQYLTFEQYQSIGGTLDLTAFNRNVSRANSLIDYATRGRIAAMSAIPDEAKTLCRDLTELFAENGVTSGNLKSRSQSAGSVSESETYETLDTFAMMDAAEQLCCDYLLAVTDDKGVPLLYRGVGQ